MTRRGTIGSNPLDAVIPDQLPAREVQAPRSAPKQRLTVHLPPELIDRLKNAVYWTPGLTLAGLAEEAMEAVVSERERRNGGPFARRREELRGGRPLK
jgi:hypothetical protein